MLTNNIHITLCKTGLIVLLLAHTTTLHAQDLRQSLFKEADIALKEANEANALLLSPDNYEEGMERYQDATRALRDGDNLQDIREKLSEAVSFFNKATEATKLAKVTFTSALAARDDAIEARAPQYASRKWTDAEDEFKGAAQELEDGDARDAKREATRAENMYREAELTAIKSNILESARSLIRKADQVDADDQAPNTLAKAKKLVNDTERALESSRYDMDEARNLAKQAEYEASHALWLHQYIEQLDRNDQTREEVILMTEEPLQRVAGQLLINARFNEGFEQVADTIIHHINVLNDSLNQQQQQIEGLSLENNSLISANQELRERLEELTNERMEISQQVEAMNQFRQRFDTINNLFTSDEARVIRDGNSAIIRLKGLNFDVGKSVIKPEHFGLLTKVKQAINTFPRSMVTVEGHTDSQGGDEPNMKLSQERADAVMSYLLANMNIEPLRMEARGYGETNPIANNETAQGRKLNRRIDIVINPESL